MGLVPCKKWYQRAFSLSLPCEDTTRNHHLQDRKRALTRNNLLAPWSWTCWPAEVWGVSVLLKPPGCGLLLCQPELTRKLPAPSSWGWAEHHASFTSEGERVGGTPSPWRGARVITVPATISISPSTSTLCILVSELLREQSSQALDGTALMWRRDRTKSAPVVGADPSRQTQGNWPAHPDHGVWNIESWECTWGPLMHTLKRNRGEHSESETGRNISIKTISLALLLALDKGGSQAP